MALSDVIEKLGRAIFEAPFGANRISADAPELAEIRLAVLDAVKAKSHRAGAQSVFPYNLVRIHLRGVPAGQAGVFQSEFLVGYFAQEMKSGLTRANYRFPEDLRVEIRTTPILPAQGEEWLWVETESERPRSRAASGQSRKAAKLVVMNGTANQPELVIHKARTNIGRTMDVYRADGPSRRNDLAFTEDNEVNRSVSREHAHILYSKRTGECRIYNDRWYKTGPKAEGGCGLWITRDGLSQPVHRSARGTLLKPGDEIHLGQAVIGFQGV